MIRLLFFILFFTLLPTKADTLENIICYEQKCQPSSCCHETSHSDLRSQIERLQNKLDSLEGDLSKVKDEKVEYSLSIKALKEKYSTDANDEWNIYMASWTLLGLILAVLAVGGFFIIKENGNTKKIIELAEKEVEFAKRNLEQTVKQSITDMTKEVTREAEIELDIFRKRIELLDALGKPDNIDNDAIYAAVSYLKVNPRTSFKILYSRLLELNLEGDVSSLIENALDELEELVI